MRTWLRRTMAELSKRRQSPSKACRDLAEVNLLQRSPRRGVGDD
jgi:hypothetical protein